MPRSTTVVTELATAAGILGLDVDDVPHEPPAELVHVDGPSWQTLRAGAAEPTTAALARRAAANGRAFRRAHDGLRGRPPARVEWKGNHRPPGTDVIPADLRVDWVYLVSCKYLSKVLVNPGPSRLFDGLLGEAPVAPVDWFDEVAADAYQAFYAACRDHAEPGGLPEQVGGLTRDGRRALKAAYAERTLPPEVQPAWAALCRAVADGSASRWAAALAAERGAPLRLLWRMLRITTAAYFVLGAGGSQGATPLRLRVDSAWDWNQAFELGAFEVQAREGRGQPEVGWSARIRVRDGGSVHVVDGHVEVRWSHGRFGGNPEAKVYLDTPLASVPGYHPLG